MGRGFGLGWGGGDLLRNKAKGGDDKASSSWALVSSSKVEKDT
jgi:hypothetical protein